MFDQIMLAVHVSRYTRGLLQLCLQRDVRLCLSHLSSSVWGAQCAGCRQREGWAPNSSGSHLLVPFQINSKRREAVNTNPSQRAPYRFHLMHPLPTQSREQCRSLCSISILELHKIPWKKFVCIIGNSVTVKQMKKL